VIACWILHLPSWSPQKIYAGVDLLEFHAIHDVMTFTEDVYFIGLADRDVDHVYTLIDLLWML